jgi:hypothetical protein
MSRLARQAISALGLLAVVMGIPAALVGFVGWPLPRRWPSVEEVRLALAEGWTPNEAFVLGVLAIVAWLLWAQLLRHVAVALSTQRRALAAGDPVPTPSAGAGLGPRVASWLVAGLFLTGPLLPSVALAGERPGIPAVLDETRALDPFVVSEQPPAVVAVASDVVEAPARSYVVGTWDERRECLWTIAERYLGDPTRWPEVLQLNAGVAQPSGRFLADDPQHWLYPGMELRLPADATGPDLLPASSSPSVSAEGMAPVAPGPSPAAEPAPVGAAMPSTVAPSAPGVRGQARSSTVATTTPTSVAPRTTDASPPQPPTVPADGAPAPRAVVPDPVPLGREPMRLAAALALGLPVFAAGGVALHLNRRRRIQVARHRPGRDIVRPDPALEPLECRIRAIAADEASPWVDAALRVLAAELCQASLPVPEIICVRAGDLGLEVLLAQPSKEAPPSFAAVDQGHVWRLDPELELAELQHRAGDHVAPFPAMVSVGLSPEGPVLVDLETLGVLSVEGDAARVSSLLAGAAVELSSAPWAEGIDLRLMDAPPSLEGVEGVTVVEELGSLRQHLITTAAGVSDALGARPSTLAARLDGPGEAWLPTVAVVDTPTPAEGLAELARRVGGGCGVAVVARGPIEDARWRLSVVAEGFARLEGPLGIDVGHLRATGDIGRWAERTGEAVVETDVGHLDEGAIAAAAALLSAASHDDDVAPLVELGAEAPRVRPRPRREHHDVWVDVLGPVKVTGWAEPIGRRRKLEELVVYLATHDEPVPAERIRCAVWPDTEVKTKSFIQAVSRARRHLGGPAYLPEAAHGAYRRGPGVGCSWIRFKELAAAAARSDRDDSIALWRQALSLVRGEPFAGVAKGTYVWAWSPGPGPTVYNMQVAITRAADTLGTLALAHDDPDTALWATRQGLLAMPEQLSLFEWEMRVAAHRRDRAALDAAYRARRRAQETMDPFGGVSPECVRLYEELVARMRERSG